MNKVLFLILILVACSMKAEGEKRSQMPSCLVDTVCPGDRNSIACWGGRVILPKKDSFTDAVLARSLGLYLMEMVGDTMVVVTDNRRFFYNNSLQNVSAKELRRQYKKPYKISYVWKRDWEPASYNIISSKTDTLIFGRFMTDNDFSLTAGNVESRFCDSENLQKGASAKRLASELGFVWSSQYVPKYMLLIFAPYVGKIWYSKYNIGYRPYEDKYPCAFIHLFYNKILVSIVYDKNQNPTVGNIKLTTHHGNNLYEDYVLFPMQENSNNRK